MPQQVVVPWRKALATENTDTTYEAKAGTTTKPSGDGVFDLLDESNGVHVGIYIPEKIILLPYGANANNETFDMRLWGWSRVALATPVWIPQILVGLNVVLGNITCTDLLANGFLADTLTEVEGKDGTSNIALVSGDADIPARCTVPLQGVELIEFDFDADAGGSASAADNCLFRFLW